MPPTVELPPVSERSPPPGVVTYGIILAECVIYFTIE